MNEPFNDMGDDKALDEYLAGGSAVSRRYRDLGADAVPPELDRLVLQRARAEVARPSRTQTWRRWSVPVALAASVVLAVAVLLETGVRQEHTTLSSQAMGSQAQAPASAPAATELERKSEISREESARSLPEVPPAAEREVIVQIAPVPAAMHAPAFVPPAPMEAPRQDVTTTAERAVQADAPALAVAPEAAVAEPSPPDGQALAHVPQTFSTSPAPAVTDEAAASESRARDADSELSQVVVTGARRAPAVTSGAGPRNTIPRRQYSVDEQSVSGIAAPASASPAAAATENTGPHDDPARWLESIRQLRKEGKGHEADQEWEKFRAAFPDYAVAGTDAARPKR